MGTAAQIFEKLSDFIGGTKKLKMEFYTLGYQSTSADGFLAIGRPNGTEGLYVAVTHSGITLAPALGALGAAEILDDVRHELLQPYHPDRLIS